METATERGEIITFYSYKGGTGRSMALANIACLLSGQGSGPVLMVDWDLEAPGLHRYFRDWLKLSARDGPDRDAAIDRHEGLVDLFCVLDVETTGFGGDADEEEAARRTAKLIDDLDLERYIIETEIPGLHLMKSGQENDGYSSRVNTFQWEGLFNRVPWIFQQFGERLVEQYRYVLIDSRTGLTDTSGICTTLLPEKLVVVFTPNRQSFTGVKKLIEQATKYRRTSDDLRPLVVFPLPSRIEAGRPDLREIWRGGDTHRGIEGYQPLFQDLLKRVYGLPSCDLNDYFDEIQIQQVTDYAYGEEVAVLAEKRRNYRDRFSLTRSYAEFTTRLVQTSGPWQSLDGNVAAGEEGSAQSGPTIAERLRPAREYLQRHLTQILVTGVLAALTLAFVVWLQWRDAAGQRREAEQQRTATESQLRISEQRLQESEQKVKDLEQPLKALQAKDVEIKGLVDQVAQQSGDLAKQRTAAAQVQSQLNEAQSNLRDLRNQINLLKSGQPKIDPTAEQSNVKKKHPAKKK